MTIIASENKLVTYVVPNERTHKLMEFEASGSWRVFDGAKWKFDLKDKEQAARYCKQMGGTHIGYAMWDKALEANVYRDVEEISGEQNS